MARTRSINPAAPTDEDVATLSLAARYLWAFLPCHADREGRLRDQAFRLKLAILPTEAVDVNALLDELAERRHIERYRGSDGRRYIQIRSFHRYQNPHKNEVPSEIPAPEGGIEPDTIATLCEDSGAAREKVDRAPALSGSESGSSGPLILWSSESQSAPRRPEPPASPPVLEFPTAGKPSAWPLTAGMVATWAGLFPGTAVETECRAALAWILASPERKKTAKGMTRFLVGWLGRSQNRGVSRIGANGAQQAPPRKSWLEENNNAAIAEAMALSSRKRGAQ